MKSQIMCMESKADGLVGEARIGRVSCSKSGRTLRYAEKEFINITSGFKANYMELGSGEHYWISRPRKDGKDRLYDSARPVEIDNDMQDEYWSTTRGLPALASRSRI